MTVRHPSITVHFGGEEGNAPYFLGLVDGGPEGNDTSEEQVERFTTDATLNEQSWGKGLDAVERGVGQWWEMPLLD